MISLVASLSHLYLLCLIGFYAAPINDEGSNVKNASLKGKLRTKKFRLPENASIVLPKFELPQRLNLTKVAQELKDFGIHSLKEDDHLEAVPLDRLGRANPHFHKELFLGNHELFENDIQNNEDKRNLKLKEIFNQANIDKNPGLSHEELLSYVLKNVQDHLREAKEKNSQLFLLIDTDGDGKVTWHEYIAIYMKFHNVNSTNSSATENLDLLDLSLKDDLQHELVKIRYRWTEADSTSDNYLDLDEFLIFRHPEITGNSYKYVVDDIILQMDRNDDQKLTEGEFAFLPTSVLEDDANKEWIEMDKRWLEEQKREFHEMDVDADGFLTREELMKAYDPMNRVHIENQIKKLFIKVDDSPKDDSLSLEEIQKHADVFTDMHIIDTDKALHDEM